MQSLTRSLVPFLASLTFTAVPAFAQGPALTPSMPLPGDLDVAGAAGDQRISDVAAGGNQVLAVWQDERTDLVPNLLADQGAKDVWAARFSDQGQLVDVFALPVTQGAGDQRGPKVAWDGSAWLVAWTAQVPTQFYYTDGIEVARVAADGTVLDPTPLRITTASNTGNMELWGVGSAGDGWAVFWKDWDGASWALLGARVAADGTLIDTTPVNLGAAASQPYDGEVVFAGDEYLLVWKEWRGSTKDDIRARLYSPALSALGPMFTVASHGYYETRPAVATDGQNFLVAWERYDSCCVGGGGKVFASRVLHDGTVIDGSEGMPIYAPPSLYGTVGRDPSAAWDGVEWVVTFTKPGLLVNAARITPEGEVLDPEGFEVDPQSPRQDDSAVAGLPASQGGGGSLILWTDSRAGWTQPYDVFGALLSTSGTPTPIGVQSLAAPTQTDGDLVRVPGGALAVWTSTVSGDTRVLVQKLDARGAALQPEPLELAAGIDLANANVAWNGSAALATWDDGGGVHALLLDANGMRLSPAPIDVMPGFASEVASQGDTFLVTALDAPTNPEFVFVFSRRVDSQGVVIDPSSVFVGSSFARSQAVVGFDGGFLVAWQRNFTHDDPNSALHLRFVQADNVPGMELVVASGITRSGHNERPTLAVDADGQALLAWQIRLGGDDWDVVARRVLPGMTLLDPNWISVTTAPDKQLLPAASWNGAEYVLAWQDGRNALYFWDERTDVYGARVRSDGSVVDPNGFPLANGVAPETWPKVAGMGAGTAVFLWSAFHEEAPFGAYRIETSATSGAPRSHRPRRPAGPPRSLDRRSP